MPPLFGAAIGSSDRPLYIRTTSSRGPIRERQGELFGWSFWIAKVVCFDQQVGDAKLVS